MRFAIDVTACWRPQRVGMTTVAIELAKALVAHRGTDEFVLLCSRERPADLMGLDCDAVLSPYRHEVNLKTRWLPAVEPKLESDAILYPYWPSPPFRHHDAPPAAVFVHDLAFRLRPKEVPWQQRVYMGTILGPALRNAAAVIVPSQSTRRDLLDLYKIPGLESKIDLHRLRRLWAGVSPMSYFKQFARWPRKSLIIYAKYDLTFLPELSHQTVAEFERHGLDHKVAVLPCGHYTTGETPYKYMDGWHLASFLRTAF